MPRKALRTIAVLTIGGAALLAVSGCAGNYDPNQTIAQALGQFAQTAGQVPALNQMTIGDLVAGFQQFVTQLDQANSMGPQGSLTADQMQQIQDLQSKLDSGQITEQDFETQVNAIIGNAAPHFVFGGPFARGPRYDLAQALNLTAAQKQQAQDVFQRAHDDIQKLQQDAQAKILAVLTPDQETQLNQGAEVQLTDAQGTQIDQIRTDLRTAVQARHQQARDEFRAILTADQQAIFDKLEPPPASPPAGQ